MKKFLTFSFLLILLIPSFAFAADPSVASLIPCGQVVKGVLRECGFGDLMLLVRNILDYLIKYIIIPGATVSFAFAGFKIMTNPDNAGKRSEAKKSMFKVAIGLVVILAAWLLVKTVLTVFLKPEIIQQIPINL